MIKIIITVDDESQKAAILSVLKVGELENEIDFSFGLITEIQGAAYFEESTGAPEETPTPISDFVGWFDTLPEGTRKQIEDASLFPLMQTAYLMGKRKLRQDNQEGMDLLEINLVETLNILESLR